MTAAAWPIDSAAQIEGRVMQETLIPAREYGTFELYHGQVMRIIDVEGEQVPDVTLLDLRNLSERLSTQYTKSLNNVAMPTVGHHLYSLECNRLATIVADTVGDHDWSGGFCSEPLNFLRYGVRGTRNCRDNLAFALAPYGLTKRDVTEGANIAFFMHRVPGEDGSFKIGPPSSKAGDYVEIQAVRDVLVAISACPQDRGPTNGFNPTSVGIVIYDPA
ncbi:MAG: uncharacterized protein QOH61_1418 [Chloroflexota bacterium]|jgi:uncharacterized protein YcgI (DUF1989 family)|nr:uncharacterized protein [Chloroflexota bacterium]